MKYWKKEENGSRVIWKRQRQAAEDALALKAEYEDKIKSIDKEAQEIYDAARKKAKKAGS